MFFHETKANETANRKRKVIKVKGKERNGVEGTRIRRKRNQQSFLKNAS